DTLKLRKAKLGTNHPDTLVSMNNLALGYLSAGKPDLAVPLLEESLKLTKAKLGADHPETLTNINNLAGAYQAAGKLDLALPLYGSAGLKQRAGTTPVDGKVRLTEALTRLVQLYAATASKGDAAKWRATLEQHEGTLVGSVQDVGDGLTLHGRLDEQAPTLV